ncbi:hypothetical protein PMIN01_12023 [Paraphaeosphaeria minitans]|uniref:Uncharacterized protein n=1 Tax=Paraphaeosphaeria minitans TaxID=565426 RepID=A0A9P6KKS6_9PLEO|nr:hypothetical protein PMIN01_11976 [Paraphaeosphaeria minitans]KAF9730090.1 hypothetical protein PMIN01_12023 [Paraphaeosphaeria minitans]
MPADGHPNTQPSPAQSVPPRARRAANNNYQKPSERLSKLCREYDVHIYFLACRNDRFNGFVFTKETGQPSSPSDRIHL